MESSQTVLKAVDTSVQLSKWISANHPARFRNEGSNDLALAFASIALEHREAVLLLVHHGARTSATALARPVYEAWTSGLWAWKCATPDDRFRALTEGILPGFDLRVRRLDKALASGGTVAKNKATIWETLSGLTHGGPEQLANWMGPEGIAPRHSDAQILQLLRLVDTWGLAAGALTAELAGVDPTPYVERMKAVSQA